MSCNKSDLCLIAAMMVYLAIGGGSKGLLSHFRSIQPIIYMQAFLLQWSAKLGQPLVEPAALKPKYAGHSFCSGAATSHASGHTRRHYQTGGRVMPILYTCRP